MTHSHQSQLPLDPQFCTSPKTLEKVTLLTNKAVGNATLPPISASGKVEMAVPPETGESKATDASSTLPTYKGGGLSSPEVEILGAWRQLEDSLRGSSAQQSLITGGWNRPQRVEETARELGLDADEIAALAELRKLRNQVAHSVDAPVTDTEAARFKALTERLLLRINRPPGPR
jgi:hypothetical protein